MVENPIMRQLEDKKPIDVHFKQLMIQVRYLYYHGAISNQKG